MVIPLSVIQRIMNVGVRVVVVVVEKPITTNKIVFSSEISLEYIKGRVVVELCFEITAENEFMERMIS